MKKIENASFLLSKHTTEIQGILKTFPPLPLSGWQKFPLLVGYGSFLEQRSQCIMLENITHFSLRCLSKMVQL